MKYGIGLSMKKLSEDVHAAQIVYEAFPDIKEIMETNPAVNGIALKKLSQYAPRLFPEESMAQLDAALKEYGNAKGLTAKELEKVEHYQALEQNRPRLKETETAITEKRESFLPGKVWKDTKGERIQAHGGALFYENNSQADNAGLSQIHDGMERGNTYYWYGENKEFTDGKSDIWTWGIRAYRSEDLYNWEDIGLIIKPELTNPDSNLFPEMRVDRPHIIKCEKTQKYVAWLKLSGPEACFLVLQADTFTGPYEIVRENYQPLGSEVGDFDIVRDSRTQKAYLFMDADHKRIVGIEMSEDYLTAEKEVSSQYENMVGALCREGIALFERGGKKYMLTSGMTGYIPNQSDAAVSSEWTLPFISIGDPHVGDTTRSSFNSQFSQVFKVPGKKDLYIALADRWVPEYPVDARKADMIRRCIAHREKPQEYPVTPEELQEFAEMPALENVDTSIADYVWLPITFEDGQVKIAWYSEWKLEDYE